MVSAKDVKSRLWFVRADGQKSFLKEKCELLARGLDVVRCIAAYHTGKTGENPHTHICIEIRNEIQKQSFAIRIKNLFEIVKKSQYALDVWDGHDGKGAMSYLYHEENAEILCNKGFTDTQLAAAKEANAAVQAVVAVNQERASNKLVEKALTRFEGEKPDRIDILYFMLQAINSGENYHPGSFMLKKYVEEVQIKLIKTEDELWYYAQTLENNLWR